MAYTVKQLAKLSGVSVRTLHFYDEIGLLKPHRVGENGYRYYEEENLLMLQQILFFRELGFPLDAIQKIITQSDFDRIQALRSHRKVLLRNAQRTQELIRTIDKTLAKLKGESVMKDQEIFAGFDPSKQKDYEKELIEKYGDSARKNIEESKKRVKSWTKEDWDRTNREAAEIYQGLIQHLEKKTPVSDPGVQKLIRLHYQWVCYFWTPNKDAYIGLGASYTEHPDFRKFYECFHPELASYLAQGMKTFAENEL